MHRVHAALGSGHPEVALDLLDGNENGWDVLEEEARAARISALCKLGRDVEANGAIDGFLRRWPRSVLAERLRGGCVALVGARGNAEASPP